VVPVAILASTDFDINSVDPATVVLEGAKPVRWIWRDVNHDGQFDLLFHFQIKELGLTEESTMAVLTGKALDGTDILGMDTVDIVSKKKGK